MSTTEQDDREAFAFLLEQERIYNAGAAGSGSTYPGAPYLFQLGATLPANIGPGEWGQAASTLWVSAVDVPGNNHLLYYQTLGAGQTITIKSTGYPDFVWLLSGPGTYDNPSASVAFPGAIQSGSLPTVDGASSIVVGVPPQEELAQTSSAYSWISSSNVGQVQEWADQPERTANQLSEAMAYETVHGSRITLLNHLQGRLEAMTPTEPEPVEPEPEPGPEEPEQP